MQAATRGLPKQAKENLLLVVQEAAEPLEFAHRDGPGLNKKPILPACLRLSQLGLHRNTSKTTW